ncbi:MAG: hypothetical protein DMG12_01980 [Acidobacteria bacterium]|nr:MAG: hypothetical protein DMG12_01980 [Acidobacteriota bacterium]
MSQPQWRKNQIAVTVSGSFLAFGYTLVMPFLPMYVRQLGIESTGGIAFWSGIILGASPLIASLVGPLWGHVGDLKGMKLIATRATAANSVFWFLMGFSRNVWQLFLLRALLGLLGGFNNVAIAVITQGSPKEKVPSIIGTLQSTQILSAAIGPLLGGVLAASIGIRNTFLVTGLVNFGSFLSIVLLYTDQRESQPQDLSADEKASSPSTAPFWKRPEYFTTVLILFFVNMADRTFGPIIPLFLVFREGQRQGVQRMVVTHAMTAPVLMDIPQMQEATKLGAFIEFVGGSLTGADAASRIDGFAEAIRKVGPEFCILSSDLGQRGNALPPDGFGAFLLALRAKGFTQQEIDRMSKQNPARLLGLP